MKHLWSIFEIGVFVVVVKTCTYESPIDPLLQCLEVGQEKYTIRKCQSDFSFENGTLLAFHCLKGGFLVGDFKKQCNDGKWSSNDVPTCQKTCPELIFNPVKTSVVCNNSTQCRERQIIGTTANISCISEYERPKSSKYTEIQCFENETWSNVIYDCIKVHIDVKNVLPLNTGGEETEINKVPYHAAVFQRQPGKVFQKCGATIISQRALVTAAHCFYHGTKRTPNTRFFIIAGKFHRSYTTIDPNTQESEISEVYIHDSYKNLDTFRDDLALVILETAFHYNPIVQKAEVDLDFDQFTEGRVSGWGLNESQKILSTLHTVKLDVVDCVGHENISEKFCAGGGGRTVCRGDSGGGFIVERNGVNYVVGVVSSSINKVDDDCDPNNPARFTRLSPYLTLFQKAKRYLLLFQTCEDYKFKCSSDKCINIEQVCDGNNDCDDDEALVNCDMLALQKMLQIGIDLLRVSKFYENRYPNWVIPTGAVWILGNFLSQSVTNENVQATLSYDFGISRIDKGDNILRNIQETVIYQSQFFYTKDEITLKNDSLPIKYLTNVKAKRKGPPEFFYPNLFRLGVYLNADYSYKMRARPINLTFIDALNQSIQTSMFCFNNKKTEMSFIKELDTDAVSIPLTDDKNLKLFILIPKTNIDLTLNALKSFNLRLIEEKLYGNSKDVCLPEFKVMTSVDYTPVLYKAGYDYFFNLDPVDLNFVNEKAHFQTNIRGFFSFSKDEHYKTTDATIGINVDQTYVINKPFIFIVREEMTKSVLFLGKVLEPYTNSRYINAYVKCKIFSEEQCEKNL